VPRRVGRGGGPAASGEDAGRRGPRIGRDAPGAAAHRYQMRQKLLSIGDDFTIEDESGQRAFTVDGKALRLRSTLRFLDANGTELYHIQEKVARVRDTMEIERAGGGVAAKVHNALLTPLRDRWSIDVPGGQDLSAVGNILDHEYRIERGGQPVATVSKAWFRARDTYGVEVAVGEDVALMLAIAVVIDMMGHEDR
jgi:uncharacterized protein YxjI